MINALQTLIILKIYRFVGRNDLSIIIFPFIFPSGFKNYIIFAKEDENTTTVKVFPLKKAEELII